jgi:hypothetical protein
VAVFALSSRPTLLPFWFIALVVVGRIVARLISGLPVEREQLMLMLFATGVVAWIAFALWYLAGPSVLRRGMIGAWVSGTGQQDFSRFIPGSLFRRNATSGPPTSRATATSQYLIGADSNWNSVLLGAFITFLIAVTLQLRSKQPDQSPLTFILVMLAVSSVMITVMGVRRARLLWLRAGLDRAALFAVIESHALRATLSSFAVPVVVFVSMGIVRQPTLAAPLLLHTATQMALGVCAVYTGATVTRGVSAGILVVFLAMGIVAIAAMSILEPHRVISPMAHIVAFSLFSGLALVLRGFAKRAWLKLDWRMTGPALSSFGRRG